MLSAVSEIWAMRPNWLTTGSASGDYMLLACLLIVVVLLLVWLFLVARRHILSRVEHLLQGHSAIKAIALTVLHILLTVIPLLVVFPFAWIALMFMGGNADGGPASRQRFRSRADKPYGGADPIGGSYAVEAMLFDGDQDKIRLARTYRNRFGLPNSGWFWGQFGK